jgi:hydrogenase maturation protease
VGLDRKLLKGVLLKMPDLESRNWTACAKTFLESKETLPLRIVGVGNPIRRDDGVGIFIASHLRKKFGARPNRQVRIDSTLAPEFLFSKMTLEKGSLLVLDAIEQNSPPGSIVFAKIEDTKFGYFATHNVPLTLIPNLAGKIGKIFVLGIQPENIDIGEGLSEVVLHSANEVIAEFETIFQEGLLVARK